VHDFIVNARAAETHDPPVDVPGEDEPYDWRDA